MKMKFTNATLMDIYATLGKFDECTGRLGYAIHKTKRKIMPEVQDFEQIRNSFIIKYGEKDENDNYTIHPGTEGYQKYLDEIIPIANDVIEIEVHQISQEEFDESDYYVKDAKEKDYDIIELLFVKKEEEETTTNEE